MILIALYLKFLVFKTCPDALLFPSSSFFFSTLAKVGYFLAGKKEEVLDSLAKTTLIQTIKKQCYHNPPPSPHLSYCACIIVGGLYHHQGIERFP